MKILATLFFLIWLPLPVIGILNMIAGNHDSAQNWILLAILAWGVADRLG